MLVIGSAGHLGQVLVPYLKSINFDFTAGVRNLEAEVAQRYKALGVNLLQVDLSDSQDKLVETFSQFKTILFITPGIPTRKDLMLNGFKALALVKTVEFATMISGTSCRVPNDCSLGQVNYLIEEELKKSISSYCILRLSWFYENNFGSIKPIKFQKEIYGPIDGSNVYQSISLYDCSEAIGKIFSNHKEHQNKIYDLVSEVISFNDLAKAFTQGLGFEVKYQNKGYEFMANVFKMVGFDDQISKELLQLYELVEKKKPYMVEENNQLEKIIQRKPMTNLQWIQKNAAMFKN